MTAIEFVLLTPVLFFMIFATVQFALYFFADHVAQAAAQAGARKARATAHDAPGRVAGRGAGRGGQLHPASWARSWSSRPDVKMLQPEQNTVGVEITAKVPTVFPGSRLHGARAVGRARWSGSYGRATGN